MKKTPSKLRPKAKFSNRSLLLFGLVFAAVGGYIIWRSFAAPAPPTIYLSPASQTVGPGATITVQVRENSGTTTVNAVQANLSYPTSLLTFVSSSTTGTAFSVEAQDTGGGGVINLARGTTTPVSGDQLIATLTFTATSTSGAASVVFTNGTALVSSGTNQDILGGLSATGGGTYTVDATGPTTTVTSPANGATISAGGTQTVTVTATDAASSVAKVEIYIDGTLATTDSISPYNYSWNTTGVTLGTHMVSAKGYDTFNNVTTSATNTVTVADQTPPTTSVTAPSNGAFLKGTVSFTANASDNAGGTGMAKVEFYVDGALKNTDSVSPYSFSWDTTTATNAAHSLTVKAYDNATPANVATSTAVSVTVDNSAPTTPGSFRMTSNTLTTIVLAWNASTDNNTVTAYQISRNGTVITTTGGSTLTFTDSSLAAGTSYNYSIVAQDGAGNSSAAATLTTSTQAAKPGDLNGDNQVNVTDLSILLSNFNTSNAVADINKDGSVNIFDLSILLTHFGT
jgi:chitodextrinase